MRILPMTMLGFLLLSVAAVQAASIIEAVIVEPFHFDVTTDIKIAPIWVEGAADATLEYRWFVNGNEVLHVVSETFPGALLRRGDELSVEVVPVAFGGERLQSFISEPLVAGNASPEIVSEPPSRLTDQGFSYLVKATDPDADPLKFQLAQGPVGMVIDSNSGQITWKFDSIPQGVFPVHIVVEDGHGGRAEQTFELNLSLVEKDSSR